MREPTSGSGSGETPGAGPRKRKKMALGRGLDALIPGMESATPAAPDPGGPRDYFLCDIDQIHPNPYQPRMRFSEAELESLSESIREQGVLQPLLVRQADEGFELIAGERRLRASKLAGLDRVPVVVKEISEANHLEMSIVENIHRQDLNPLEEADAYHLLMTEFDLTQEQVARRVGKKRPTVTNFLRLRQLPEAIKESILDGTLSMGHARALLGAETPAHQRAVWRDVVARDLSVRQTERMVQRLKEPNPPAGGPAPDPDGVYFGQVADDLSRQFGTKVQIRRKGRKGKVEIEFYSDEDLDRLIQLFHRPEGD